MTLSSQTSLNLTCSVIPVVVAKCGLYLKENGTEVEGTFRISGSAKRMRDLQTIFDNGPKVRIISVAWSGLMGLVWKEYRLGDPPIHYARCGHYLPTLPDADARTSDPI